MKKILVLLDGSACAEQVLPYVQLLAPLLDARIQLLRIVPAAEVEPMLTESFAALGNIDRLVADRHHRQAVEHLRYEQAAEYLVGQAQSGWGTNHSIEIDVRVGTPAEAIIDAAMQPEVALIALATHGDSGLRRWVRGSIADHVVHAATVPVLLVRGGKQAAHSRPRLAHVLVPLDGSVSATVALPLAMALAKHANATLSLLRAVTPTLAIYPDPYPDQEHPSYHALLTTLQEQAQVEIDITCGRLHREGIRATPVVATGNPAEVIVDTAQRNAADMIIMATHGATGVRRWALGSVADTVLHTSTIPLILVPVRTNDD